MFPGNFSDLCSISDNSIFFEKTQQGKLCVTNIYILIREIVEKQTEQTTAALYCMFSF